MLYQVLLGLFLICFSDFIRQIAAILLKDQENILESNSQNKPEQNLNSS